MLCPATLAISSFVEIIRSKNIVFLNELRESLKHIPHTEELVDGIFRNIAIQNSF